MQHPAFPNKPWQAHPESSVLCPSPGGSTALQWRGLPALFQFTPVYYLYFTTKIGETVRTITDKFACSRCHINPRDLSHWSSQLHTDAIHILLGEMWLRSAALVQLIRVHKLEMVSALMCLIVFAQPSIACGTSTLLI